MVSIQCASKCFQNSPHIIWNLWGILKTLWKHISWKPLKPMRTFENTLKHIIWKHFEMHNLKTIMRNFENTFEHIIWKHFETYGRFLKHILKTHHLKTIETYGEFWKHFEIHHLKTIWNLWQIFENSFETYYLKTIETVMRFLKTLKHINFENTFKHVIWKTLKPMGGFENILKHYLKTIETCEEFWKYFETYNLKTIWNLWEIFENTLKHIIWKHFETHNLKTIETFGRFLKTLWNTLFGNNLKHTIWKIIETYGEFWKHFETHYLKTIETYEDFWKHFETHYLKRLWNTQFENTLKHILKKYNLKTIETYGRILKTLWNTLFENTLKHTIWKPLKHLGDFWKHFETHYLETIWNTQFENHWNLWGILKTLWNTLFENHWNLWGLLKTLWNTLFEKTLKHTIWKPLKHLGDFWKHFENHIDTPLSYHHSGVTIETLGFQLALKWNTYVQPCMERKSAFFTLLNV